ncbi:SRPBCC family protein [Mangrovitalea sediminis]|uniref:SRPBCC family protein n=1 Tax=Mangrovitalea sediminis TaxID=1982043 RepID=UPI000BE4F1E4|nr:SRPBCC domain-containing protein [Mangrovitalea sediminis]
MTNNLLFDFIVDKKNNTMTIKREFAAKRKLVWDCYTKSELLDQWFAPKPLKTRTKHMDFREGGYWHYVMVTPDGEEYWGRTDYQTITPIDNYTALDGFSDESGVINSELPRSKWDVTFTDASEHSIVRTVVSFGSTEELEKVIEMGMQAGMTSTLERLDELLQTLTK